MNTSQDNIIYRDYKDETYLDAIQVLVAKDLSEPYSIFTYRYFLQNWPNLCICAFVKKHDKEEMIGTIICKADPMGESLLGYVAMLTVSSEYRKLGIGRKLAVTGIERMIQMGCTEIILETEVSNVGATMLYEKLGFIKEERLARYYLNSGDAYRLRLWINSDTNSFIQEEKIIAETQEKLEV